MVHRHDEHRLPGGHQVEGAGGSKGTDDLGPGHIQQVHGAIPGEDQHLGTEMARGVLSLVWNQRSSWPSEVKTERTWVPSGIWLLDAVQDNSRDMASAPAVAPAAVGPG